MAERKNMRVIVPFAIAGKTQPWAIAAVRLALQQDGIDAEYVHMQHDNSYYELLSKMWNAQESFTIVEHDIVVWPGAINILEQCKEGWCTLPYYCSAGWITDGLGCTKFSKDFIMKYSDFLAEPFSTCCQHTIHYCGLDRTIAHKAEMLGLKPHVHFPGVVNLNDRWT